MRNFNIASGLARSAADRPQATAFVFGKDAHAYGAFVARVKPLAALLRDRLRSRRVGILASRSIEAYLGIAATAWAGGTYVPLNSKWPEARLIELLDRLELDALVVDRNGARLLTPAVRNAAPRLVLGPPGTDTLSLDVDGAAMDEPAHVGARDTAYIIFTSGTTGTPKGVVVSAGSLDLYLDATRAWTRLTPDDRVAEAHDVTFDLSVHNTFLAWEAGAALHVMSALDLVAPARFITRHGVTCWMSVPTLAAMMREGDLAPGALPSLRLSVFCGEPLPLALVERWAEAAPNSVIENIYGPTECTVVCTRQRCTRPPVVTPGRNILAIGRPYETFDVALLDGDLGTVPDGEIGEIALASAQLSDGYFAAPEQTAECFRTIEGRRWYLTGDLGRRDGNGVLHHMGRADNQVKLKGNRVELEEVEAHLRRAAGTQLAAVVAWPVVDGSAQGLVGFVAGSADEAALQAAMAETLPRALIPGTIRGVAELPRNANGKVDRMALIATLDASEADVAA